jgi:hypothetical protein
VRGLAKAISLLGPHEGNPSVKRRASWKEFLMGREIS